MLKKIAILFFCLSLSATAYGNERILALSPHVAEILYAIGAGDEVVGAIDYCDYPQAVTLLPKVGAFNRINAEAALKLRPSIAFTTNLNTPGVAQLQSLGVRVFQSAPRSVDEVLIDIRRIGHLVGYAKQADTLASELQTKLATFSNARSPTRLFYEISANPLITTGKTTFITDTLTRIGAKNIFDDINLASPRVNIEAVIANHPQLILVPSRNPDIEPRIHFWEQWLGKNIQVLRVEPDTLHRPGPRIIEAMQTLSQQVKEATGELKSQDIQQTKTQFKARTKVQSSAHAI